MKPRTRRRLLLLAGLTAWLAALWLLWWTPVVYPLKLFVVLIHEVSHGLMAIATGGRIEQLVITADEGGYAVTAGGSRFLILSAGYLGSLLFGVLLLLAARARRRPRPDQVTFALGAALLVITALWVRSLVGVLFGLVVGAGLLAARRLPRRFHVAVLTALGLTSAVYALLDVKSDVLDRPHLPSDAVRLAELTGVPALVWGLLWIGLGLWVAWWLVRRAWARA